MRSLISEGIKGFGDEDIHLATFGVLTNRDGSISVDAQKFATKYDENPDKFNAILNSRVLAGTNAITPTISGTSYTPGSYSFEFDGSEAKIDGDTMNLSDGVYSISSGNAEGLSLTSNSTSLVTTVHLGKSLLDKTTEYFEQLLSFGNDIDSSITRYDDQITEYKDDLQNFDRQIESLRAQYVDQFSGMDTAVASLNRTKDLLNGFMDS